MIKALLFLAIVIIPTFNILGQRIKKTFEIEWKEIGLGKPYAVDCFYNDSLPWVAYKTFRIEIPDATEAENISVQLENFSAFQASETFKGLENKAIPNNFDVSFYYGIEKQKPMVYVTLNIIRSNGSSLELLSKATFGLTYAPISKKEKFSPKTSSVLAEGRWIRIKIGERGVYKITYKNLVDWGFSDPQNVRIYGTGGRMLSKKVNNYDPVDLYENPIYMETGGDGVFNDGDYILFYAQGIERVFYNRTVNRYFHENHSYSEEAFYFVTTRPGAGKRISTVSFLSQNASSTTTSGDYIAVYEKDVQNPLRTGRMLFDELLTANESRNFSFSVPVSYTQGEPVKLYTQVIGFQSSLEPQCSFQFSIGNTSLHRTFLIGSNPNAISDVWDLKQGYSEFSPSGQTFTTQGQFFASSVAARGAVDYLMIVARINLSLPSAKRINFWESRDIASNSIKEFRAIGNNITVWDVTNPLNPVIVTSRNEGDNTVWKYDMSVARNFHLFVSGGEITPLSSQVIANQNIMGTPVPDMVIITAPAFRQQAEQLAAFRRTNNQLSVLVLEPQTIYNEFSSGIPDVSAIRNMLRMFYLRSGDGGRTLKYALLIGDGSFNNKWAARQNNYILTYQSVNSQDDLNSIVSDDFFGLLDEGEGGQDLYTTDGLTGLLDIGVGRLPVESLTEANSVINKTTHYNTNPTLDSWKNRLTFLADDADNLGDFGLQRDAYDLAKIVRAKYPWFNNHLILMDAYPQVSTPAGHRYPKVREAINTAIHSGTLLFNYTGHGSANQLAHEAVVDKNMVNNWINRDYLPFMMTASCEIAPYDNPNNRSLGELMMVNPNGGAIALFTTTRKVYASGNQNLSIKFYNRVFERSADGNYSTLGEILSDTKNMTSSGTGNHRKFSLLGDPSMKLLVPPFRVRTDSINGFKTGVKIDTLRALSKVRVSGSITDTLGNPVDNFNGIIYPTVYDKFRTRLTLNNDNSGVFEYQDQDNILYRGRASVTNGKFSFEFYIPLDINYDFGFGKISYYAQNGTIDAQGSYRNIVIGGSNNSQFTDNIGPEIRAYLNDTNFVSGSTVNESPTLILRICDEHGINTTGNGIGHDITAYLKHDPNNIIILNRHFESDINNYRCGTIRYQLLNLPEGPNQITIRAWDILNNYSEKQIDFLVANSEQISINHVMNYPNPFTTNTKFLFEHNQPHLPLEITIQIFTVSGKVIKTLQTNILGSLYQFSPLTWDGRDEFGNKIGRGVYIYSVKIKTPDGQSQTKFEKLVIL